MKSVLSLSLAILLVLGGVAGCSEARITSVASATPTEGDPERAPDPALAAAINDFGFDLMREVGRDAEVGSRENIVISPFSAHTALTMTLNGARDTTAEEMNAVLRLGALELDDTNQAYADLLAAFAALDASSDTTLTVANSLWPHTSPDGHLELLPEFLETDRRFFGAQLEPIDLRATEAADIINAWIAEQTAGDITELIDYVPADAVLYLVNAVHLDAEWADAFDPMLTRDREFATVGQLYTVPFLHRQATYRYSESRFGTAVRLPAADGRLAMWVLVPPYPPATPNHYKGLWMVDPSTLLDTVLSELDAQGWREVTGAAEDREIALALPRFGSRYRADLAESLEAMGMTSAFSGTADFSGIATDAELYISRVLHEAHLAVDEEGTRASAATAVQMDWASAAIPEGEVFEMTVDRPFLVAIEDEPTGTLLFLGAIHDPR